MSSVHPPVNTNACYSLLVVVLLCLVTIVVGCQGNSEANGQAPDQQFFQKYSDSVVIAVGNRQFATALSYMKIIRDHNEIQRLSTEERHTYHQLLSSIAFSMQQYDVALDAALYEHSPASSAESNNFTFQLQVAHTLKQLRDTELALVWYKAAVQSAPAHSKRDLYNNIAELSARDGLYRTALTYLDSAQQIAQPGSDRDVNGLAWQWFVKARCYAGLGMPKAITALEAGTDLLVRGRTFRADGEREVRMSIIKRVTRSPYFAASTNAVVQQSCAQLDAIYREDSLALAASDVHIHHNESVRGDKQVAIRSLILPPTDNVVGPVMQSDGRFITGAATDSMGWTWVGTLSGLYLGMGKTLVCADTTRIWNRNRACKSVHVWNDTVYIERYSGVVDVFPRSSLVHTTKAPIPTHRKPRVQFVSLQGETPTALVGSQNKKNVLWCYGSRIGMGSLFASPKQVQTLRTSNGQEWTSTITCGVLVNDSIAVVGTNAGVYRVNIGLGLVFTDEQQPQALRNDSIAVISVFRDSLLLIAVPIGVAYSVPVHQDGHIAWEFLSRLDAEGQLPWNNTASMVRLHRQASDWHAAEVRYRARSLEMQSDSACPTTLQPVAVDHNIAAMMYNNVLHVLDVGKQRTDVYWLTQIASAGTRPVQIRFVADRTFGTVVNDSLLLITLDSASPAYGTSIYGVRLLGESVYRLFDGGCEVVMPDGDRAAEVVIGRPLPYGIADMKVQMSLPWLGQVQSTLMNTPFVLRPSAPGEYVVNVLTADRAAGEQIMITAQASVIETWWFRLAMGCLVLLFGYLLVRLLQLRRRNRAMMMEQVALQECVQIGYDLHDALGADLVRISMIAKGEQGADGSDEIVKVTTEAGRTLRDIVWSVSETRTLDAMIAIMAERTRERCTKAGIQARISLPLIIPSTVLAPQLLRDVTLVVTEAVTNAIKHAKATVITLDLQIHDNRAVIVIADDGVGMDAERARAVKNGHGLRSFQSRANRSGFTVAITSAPQKGTSIILTIPLPS